MQNVLQTKSRAHNKANAKSGFTSAQSSARIQSIIIGNLEITSTTLPESLSIHPGGQFLFLFKLALPFGGDGSPELLASDQLWLTKNL